MRLIISAAYPPEELFVANREVFEREKAKAKVALATAGGSAKGGGDSVDACGRWKSAEGATATKGGGGSQDEVFAFDRTLSRLHEMRSHTYLVRAATGRHALASNNRVPMILYESGSALTDEEARDLFTSYDIDASGALEKPEVHLMLSDLTERRRGHRNVSDIELDLAFGKMDTDQNGSVSVEEFVEFLTKDALSNVNVTHFGESSESSPLQAPS